MLDVLVTILIAFTMFLLLALGLLGISRRSSTLHLPAKAKLVRDRVDTDSIRSPKSKDLRR